MTDLGFLDNLEMVSIDVENILNDLSKTRPVFHSEADFQHTLAWEIKKKYPQVEIRLEKLFVIKNQSYYIDLIVMKGEEIIAFELKYKTKRADIIFSNEHFYLKNQGAQDQGRYDFIKDIYRLENFIKLENHSNFYKRVVGYAIFLTNDLAYKKEKKSQVSKDLVFRIHQNRILEQSLAWGEGTTKGTMKNRESPISLSSSYILNWKNYSNIDNEIFDFLLIKISE